MVLDRFGSPMGREGKTGPDANSEEVLRGGIRDALAARRLPDSQGSIPTGPRAARDGFGEETLHPGPLAMANLWYHWCSSFD